jgi:catechol 2,3-dioxygenase-like lactoylglutathione lyase family enzyme
METQTKPRLVGINHIALEVGDVEAALAFYGAIFSFTLRGSHNDADGRRTMAFIDMGDQFLALMEGQAAGARLDRYGCGTSGSRIPLPCLSGGGTICPPMSRRARQPSTALGSHSGCTID